MSDYKNNIGVKPQKVVQKNTKHTTRQWIYGYHTVLSALQNPRRQIFRILATKKAAAKLHQHIKAEAFEITKSKEIENLLSPDAVHQGIAAEVMPLPVRSLDEIINTNHIKERTLFIVLDQVSDPRNVGAIVRSAVAFGASAIIQQNRNAPSATRTMAKAASGGLEHIDLISVPNVAQVIQKLKKNSFWTIGLDSNAISNLGDIELPKKCCLVLGSENIGLRRLTKQICDTTVRIPMSANIDSLNISNAAAVAMYEYSRQHFKN